MALLFGFWGVFFLKKFPALCASRLPRIGPLVDRTRQPADTATKSTFIGDLQIKCNLSTRNTCASLKKRAPPMRVHTDCIIVGDVASSMAHTGTVVNCGRS
ncbi:hypothetical protein GGS26DRAFT_314582 [Hypomontagnella submonticulosa]|nr:hypothetical protein GGS26DRAFT_314582 [Hypomontagnella submonticulosa]